MPTIIQVLDFFQSSIIGVQDQQLQELCAYSKAISCSYLNDPLFEDQIEVSESGPYISKLDSILKTLGNEIRNVYGYPNLSCFTDQERLVLACVLDSYGSLDAEELHKQALIEFPKGILTQEDLIKIFDKNEVVQRLRRSDEVAPKEPKKENGITLSERDFFKFIKD